MKVKLQNVTLGFPHLFEFDNYGRFSAVSIFPKNSENVKAVKDAMMSVAKEKWGAKAPAVVKQLFAGDKTCLRDGDAKADTAGFEGNYYVSAASKNARPVIKAQDGATDLDAVDGEIYPGAVVHVIIDIWAQDHPKYGKRLNAELLGVQKVADGERLTGGASVSEDDFAPIPGSESGDMFEEGDAEDSGEDLEDDIPF